MMEFFKYYTYEPSSKEQLLPFPIFLETGLVEKIAVCIFVFVFVYLYVAAQNFELFSNI